MREITPDLDTERATDRANASPSDWALLIGAVVVSPAVVRIALFCESRLSVDPADGVGVLADIASCLLVIAGLAGLAGLSNLKRLGFLIGCTSSVLWSLLNFANYEHIRELGSVVDFSYAHYLFDMPFLRGSALAPTHPVLLAVTTTCATALTVIVFRSQKRFRVRPVAVLGGVSLVLLVLVPHSPKIAMWRQSGVLTEQIIRLTRRPTPDKIATVESNFLLHRDLDGAPIIAAGPKARNVLLVILEGVSGAYLESVRDANGASSPIDMPELDRIARNGLSYSNFIATQRQTNRGEYAILCGDLPRLITAEAKMTELTGQGPIDCLPSALRAAGFSTTYLQAAPLPFMMKDQFMVQAGFDRVFGNGWFSHAYGRNHWGVDDRTLFESSLDLITELNEEAEPWFLTLLTVGTHHRYNVPEDFEGEAPKGSQAWAFEYLDLAIGEFFAGLEAAGVLEDTLVILTSDESQAKYPDVSDLRNMQTQGWGFLIALLPSQESETVEQIFAQPDVPLSILDYLQLASVEIQVSGRSIFRRYDSGREAYWGNTYLKLVAGVSPDFDLTICNEDFSSCITTPTVPGKLFSSVEQLRAATGEEVARLRHAAISSLSTKTDEPHHRTVTLISEDRHLVIRASGEQYVFGGQFLTLPADSRTDVDLDITLTGPKGYVEFAHNFLVDRQPLHVWSERLETGETLRLSYSVAADSKLENAECRFWITDYEGEDLWLDVHHATLEITAIPPSQQSSVSAVHHFEISGPDSN